MPTAPKRGTHCFPGSGVPWWCCRRTCWRRAPSPRSSSSLWSMPIRACISRSWSASDMITRWPAAAPSRAGERGGAFLASKELLEELRPLQSASYEERSAAFKDACAEERLRNLLFIDFDGISNDVRADRQREHKGSASTRGSSRRQRLRAILATMIRTSIPTIPTTTTQRIVATPSSAPEAPLVDLAYFTTFYRGSRTFTRYTVGTPEVPAGSHRGDRLCGSAGEGYGQCRLRDADLPVRRRPEAMEVGRAARARSGRCQTMTSPTGLACSWSVRGAPRSSHLSATLTHVCQSPRAQVLPPRVLRTSSCSGRSGEQAAECRDRHLTRQISVLVRLLWSRAATRGGAGGDGGAPPLARPTEGGRHAATANVTEDERKQAAQAKARAERLARKVRRARAKSLATRASHRGAAGATHHHRAARTHSLHPPHTDCKDHVVLCSSTPSRARTRSPGLGVPQRVMYAAADSTFLCTARPRPSRHACAQTSACIRLHCTRTPIRTGNHSAFWRSTQSTGITPASARAGARRRPVSPRRRRMRAPRSCRF